MAHFALCSWSYSEVGLTLHLVHNEFVQTLNLFKLCIWSQFVFGKTMYRLPNTESIHKAQVCHMYSRVSLFFNTLPKNFAVHYSEVASVGNFEKYKEKSK